VGDTYEPSGHLWAFAHYSRFIRTGAVRIEIDGVRMLRTSAFVNTDGRSVDIVVPDDQLALAIGRRGQNAKLAVKLTTWRINITSESERRAAVQESFEQAIAQAGQEGETEEYYDDEEYYDEEYDDEEYDDEEYDDEEYDDEEYDDEEYDEDVPAISSEEHDFPRSEVLTLDGVGEKMAQHLYDHGFPSIEEIASGTIEELTSVPGIGQKTAIKLLEKAQAYVVSRDDAMEPSEVVEDDE
jgi:transcription termination factor NusA